MDDVLNQLKEIVGLEPSDPPHLHAIDYDGDPLPEHALFTIQNDNTSKYKRLIDALSAQGYIVTFNDTFDTLTALSDGEPVHISLDRPEEELINEYGGQR